MQIIEESLLWTSSQMEGLSSSSKTSHRNSGNEPQESFANQSLPQPWCPRRDGDPLDVTLSTSCLFWRGDGRVCADFGRSRLTRLCANSAPWQSEEPLRPLRPGAALQNNPGFCFTFIWLLTDSYLKRVQQKSGHQNPQDLFQGWINICFEADKRNSWENAQGRVEQVKAGFILGSVCIWTLQTWKQSCFWSEGTGWRRNHPVLSLATANRRWKVKSVPWTSATGALSVQRGLDWGFVP